MRIGVLAEIRPGERRVALPPEAVSALHAADVTVTVQSGAGRHLFATDEDYRAAGAEIADSPERIAAEAELLTVVNPPEPSVIAAMPAGTSVLGLLNPFQEPSAMRALRDQGVTAYALELIPRISRAQSVDALSSQALVSGYRAALVGADLLPRFFPLFMTAAGTIPPARVLVLGAGVAGPAAPPPPPPPRRGGGGGGAVGGGVRGGDPPGRDPGPYRPAAGDRGDGRRDAAGLGRGRPGRAERRQLRAVQARRDGRVQRRVGVGRRGRPVAA